MTMVIYFVLARYARYNATEPATEAFNDFDLAAHRKFQYDVALLARQLAQTFAFASHYETECAAQMTIRFFIDDLTVLIEADDPDVFFLQNIDGLREIRFGNPQMLARTRRSIDHRRRDFDGMSQRNDDAMYADGFRGAKQANRSSAGLEVNRELKQKAVRFCCGQFRECQPHPNMDRH